MHTILNILGIACGVDLLKEVDLRKDVPQLAQVAVTKYHRPGAYKITFIFTALDTGCLRLRCQPSEVRVRAHCLPCRQPPFLCILTWPREGSGLFVPLDTNAITGAPSHDLTQIKLLSKTSSLHPPSKHQHPGMWASTKEFWRKHIQPLYSRKGKLRGRKRGEKEQEIVGAAGKTPMHLGLGPEMHNCHRKVSSGPKPPPSQEEETAGTWLQ